MNAPTQTCPCCKSEILSRGKDFPFCSARCRLLDLGAWTREQYRIKGELVSDPENAKSDEGDSEND